ncbi:MAG: glycerol-3-phosphate 1-O-acyltransferase PlsY [Defluviitaleaceae bacterium]|nr:glycerol-3-phosphate 1-O-acyltransferase PlsY [Defluviitaleaceae bacterium]
MYRLVALIIGYIIGSIQTAYYVGKLHGIDIREHGSKNAGMTNVTRTIGKRAGFFVFVVDILKGFAAFIIATIIFGNEGAFFPGDVLPGIYAGLGAVLGHCFPVLLKFRGGKGVSSTLAVILMLNWQIALIAFAIGFVVVILTRYISLASLVITFTTSVLMAVFSHQIEAVIIMFSITALIWFLHQHNIKLILTGKERKFF